MLADGEQGLEMRAHGNCSGDHCLVFPDQSKLLCAGMGALPNWISTASHWANGFSEMLQSYLNSLSGSLSDFGFNLRHSYA